MDPEVWAILQEMQRHIEVLNREMGAVMVNVEWLTWWARGMMAATGLVLITSLANLALSWKNGKKA